MKRANRSVLLPPKTLKLPSSLIYICHEDIAAYSQRVITAPEWGTDIDFLWSEDGVDATYLFDFRDALLVSEPVKYGIVELITPWLTAESIRSIPSIPLDSSIVIQPLFSATKRYLHAWELLRKLSALHHIGFASSLALVGIGIYQLTPILIAVGVALAATTATSLWEILRDQQQS